MPPPITLTLSVLPDRYAVCRLDPGAAIPPWATAGRFFSVTRTADELSIVCPEQHVPPGVTVEPGWRTFKLEGPFDFALTGILAAVAGPLAEAGIGIFAMATYDTDYVLVKAAHLDRACAALSAHGHTIRRETPGDSS
jgi:hypothetical protein